MTRGKRAKTKRSAGTRAVKKRSANRSPGARASGGKRGAALDAVPLRVPPLSPLTGGDLDVDPQRARDAGEEAVGGSVATPDQDVVDELGRALGVEQELEDEVQTSQEILRERDRHRWTQEE